MKLYAHTFFHIFLVVLSSCSLDYPPQWVLEMGPEDMLSRLIEIANLTSYYDHVRKYTF